MALALYRKYRPATFAEVVGQEHVTVPLRTALAAGRVNHAYLFSGPRGCGKTSSARILARSLNCEQGPTDEPCGTCDSCVSLAPNGPGNVDVVELDAASHGGVDDARELRDRAFYAPAQSRYRVFIVDEAHMVTTQGFNALLKIVEEPPEHLVFIFATTEPEKVLPTIRSRTHHYPFRLIPPGAMRELLERNCAAEGAVVEPAVFPLVIRAGGGSARDTQSVLDQLLAGAGPEGVTYERAVSLLGVTDSALIDEMVDALATGDAAAVYGTVDALVEAGHDPRRFAADLLDRLRDLVLLRAVPDAASRGLVSAPADQLEKMTGQAERLGPAALTRYAEIVHAGLIDMRGATAPRLLLELLCARMLLPGAVPTDAVADSAVLQRLEQLETRVAAGQPGVAAPARQPSAEPAARQPRPAEAARPQRPAEPAAERPASRQQFTRPSARAASDESARPSTGPADRSPAARPAEGQAPRPAEGQAARPAEGQTPRPAEAQAPAEPAAAGAMDAAAFRRVWPEILAAVRTTATSRSTHAMLLPAAVQSVEGNTVVIGHPAQPLAVRLSEPRNAEAIAQAISSVVGGSWQVRCVHAGAGAAAPPAPARQAAPPPQRPDPPQRRYVPAADLPPEPPPDPDPPPPEPEDEEEMLAEAARTPNPAADGEARQDPEEAMLQLLADKLGAKPVDK
ncbi:DNA polymerase III subunit gamma and tau [Actinokineospora sp. UTMC 2448]|uniref:DNA polymerase III subunit gamma and tau n=1 Tax=Actinokineospora sp. UTMC 2448 TaxID=2268449 RepID=UPI002164CBF3|nr:DNA polymerase III subunit gamma and tau [Actinokineospora sp. UTMC 2448]UVS76540.1 DNA polymerase III subunit gamma/tau [Actinokineospora sp. UTMC 2448]